MSISLLLSHAQRPPGGPTAGCLPTHANQKISTASTQTRELLFPRCCRAHSSPCRLSQSRHVARAMFSFDVGVHGHLATGGAFHKRIDMLRPWTSLRWCLLPQIGASTWALCKDCSSATPAEVCSAHRFGDASCHGLLLAVSEDRCMTHCSDPVFRSSNARDHEATTVSFEGGSPCRATISGNAPQLCGDAKVVRRHPQTLDHALRTASSRRRRDPA